MSRTHFRLLIIASVVVGLVGSFVDLLVPTLVPDAYQAAQKTEEDSMSLTRLLAALAVALPGLSFYFASVYGLYRFRSWAPRIAVVGTALILLAYPLFGTFAQSGVAVSLSYLASYLWGALLVLGYAPTYKMLGSSVPSDG